MDLNYTYLYRKSPPVPIWHKYLAAKQTFFIYTTILMLLFSDYIFDSWEHFPQSICPQKLGCNMFSKKSLFSWHKETSINLCIKNLIFTHFPGNLGHNIPNGHIIPLPVEEEKRKFQVHKQRRNFCIAKRTKYFFSCNIKNKKKYEKVTKILLEN